MTLLRQDGRTCEEPSESNLDLEGLPWTSPSPRNPYCSTDSLQFKDVAFSCFIYANKLLKSNSKYLRKAFHGVPEVFDVYVCFFNPSDVSCVRLAKRQRKPTSVRFMYKNKVTNNVLVFIIKRTCTDEVERAIGNRKKLLTI